MMDWYEVEGWDYVISHFENNGFHYNEDGWGFVFSYHSHDTWQEVQEIIKKQWGRYQIWSRINYITCSRMKNGMINYVFELE